MPRPAPGCSRPGAHRPILAIPFSLHLLLLPETPAARRAGRISECARTRVLTAGSRAPVQQALLGVAAGSQLAPEANLLVAPLEGEDLVHAHLIVVEGQLRVHGYKPGSGAPRFGVRRLCSRKWPREEEKIRSFLVWVNFLPDRPLPKSCSSCRWGPCPPPIPRLV